MIDGRDLSHYDGATPDLSGLGFTICKATQGLHFPDPTHTEHVAASATRGLVTGSYHFLEQGDGAAQVDYFLAHVGPVPAVHLFAVDIEMYGNAQHPNPADLVAFHEAFHQRMPGRTLIVYSYASFWDDELGRGFQLGCPHCVLWSSYQETPSWPSAGAVDKYGYPLVYGGWPGITMLQYATKPIDRDRFLGTRDQLVALGSVVTPPAPSPHPKPAPAGATPLLTFGMTGPRVVDIQHALDLLGNRTAHYDGLGRFGHETLRVLEVFQRAKQRHLKVTGTTDPKTWAALRAVAHPKG